MNKRETRSRTDKTRRAGPADRGPTGGNSAVREATFPELEEVDREFRRFDRVHARERGYSIGARGRRRKLLIRTAAAVGFIVLLLILIPPFRHPIEGTVTSNYFLRWSPDGRGLFDIEMHRGLDVAAERGTPVKATRSGVVVNVEEHPTYGNLVVLRHIFGMRSYYAHLSQISTREGALVLRGFRVGRVGNTGRSTGPHLHFEVRAAGRTLPPGVLLVFHDLRRFLLGV